MYPCGDAAADCSRANLYVGGAIRWCVENTGRVGSYRGEASPDGVLDMTGNAAEWVNDWYDGDYYSVSPPSNPPSPIRGTYRALRDGSWANEW